MRRTTSMMLALAVTGMVLAGCGSSSSASSTGEGASLSLRAVAYATAVNLRAGDVPGLAASRLRLKNPKTRHGWLDPVEGCDGGGGQKVTGIFSPGFSASLDHGGILSLLPLEVVQSTVFPAVSPVTASRALQAAVSARGRACFKQFFGSAESQGGDRSREPVFTQIEVSAPPSPLRNVWVYGLRTTAKSDFGTTGRSNYYEDFFAFIVGSTVITLNATADPHPVPAATERPSDGCSPCSTAALPKRDRPRCACNGRFSRMHCPGHDRICVMIRWRMWLGAANGLKPSVELVEAMDALDRRTVRRVTRLTRRGKVTSNASEARLAVALAHQTRQRAPTVAAYAAGAVMITIFLGIFAVQAVRGEIDAVGIITGAAGLWFIYMVVLGRIRLRNAVTAERLNLEILQRASQPYSPSWSPAKIDIPPAAYVAITLVMLFAYGLPFGLLQLVGPDATHSASTVIAKGSFFGVFMTIFQLTMGRGITQRRAERKAETNLRSN
jgi:hypothetical protein